MEHDIKRFNLNMITWNKAQDYLLAIISCNSISLNIYKYIQELKIHMYICNFSISHCKVNKSINLVLLLKSSTNCTSIMLRIFVLCVQQLTEMMYFFNVWLACFLHVIGFCGAHWASCILRKGETTSLTDIKRKCTSYVVERGKTALAVCFVEFIIANTGAASGL